MTSKLARSVNFQVLHQTDAKSFSPRLGRLSIEGRKPLETPNYLAVSSRGVVPHMTPDVIASSSDIAGIHMALEDFIERSSPPVMNCPGSNPLHVFTALPNSLITLLAPRRTPAVAAPNGNSNSAISVFTSTGFKELSSKSYTKIITQLRPDICIPLADVAYGTTPGAKRILKMGDRTEGWVSHLLDECEEQAIFVPILPIDYHSQLDYMNYVDEQADRIAGLAFYDHSLLPEIPATTSLSILPRLSLDEPISPHHILRQISLGIDIFTIPFINFATDAGIALTFSFPCPPTSETQNESSSRVLPLGLDMWTSIHAATPIPITPDCECYACTSHHIAFIQHLLSAKEMLGWVLIQIHNHHVLSKFFTAIRESIEKGTFSSDSEEFAKVYEGELPAKSGQGPRVRGYHYKSEANQGKKNEKPWKADLSGDGQIDVEMEIVPDVAAAELEEKGFAKNLAE